MSALASSRAAVAFFVGSISLWIGGAAFFSGVVLPLLFVNLPPADAGSVAALLFPSYFRVGLTLGLVATVSAGVLCSDGSRRWRWTLALVATMTLAQAWSALVVHPEMASLRGSVEGAARFQDLHRLSVRLNAVVLAGGAALLAAAGGLFSRRG